MQNSPAKRLLHLLVLLAFVAGLQLSLMPMAVAGDGMTATPMAGGCSGCDKQDKSMAAGECVAICAAPLAVLDQGPPLPRRVAWLPESLAVPLSTGLTVPPDSSPPRV